MTSAAAVIDHGDEADLVRRPLNDAVADCVLELTTAVARHRDTLTSASVERSALAAQLAQAETALRTSPVGSDHHRLVGSATEVLRIRLQATDDLIRVTERALADSELARDLLISALPDIVPAPAEALSGAHPRRLFQIIEDERMRIARDMHDGPAQLLANLVLKAEIVERFLEHDPSMVQPELADFKAIVRVALDETRQLIFDLRPMMLDDLGLVPALRRFVADFEQRWQIPCRFQLLGSERRLVEPGREAALFRIVQEATTNARKHAQAGAIDVVLNLTARRVCVTVKDDGRGFDVVAVERIAQRTNHLGLVSMRERAALEGATLEITSAPGRGTEVSVTMES